MSDSSESNRMNHGRKVSRSLADLFGVPEWLQKVKNIRSQRKRVEKPKPITRSTFKSNVPADEEIRRLIDLFEDNPNVLRILNAL